MKQSRKPGRALVLTLTLCVVLASRCAGVVYVKWDSPGSGDPPVFDGTSWDKAFHSIQDGVNAAGSVDEVWGARGTYSGSVILKPGVSIYGGFAGTETSRLQRNWQFNPTVVDGGGTGAVITGEDSCAIDGFVVKNGDFGVLCSERSPTVTNNRIIGSIQGIYAWCASPIIANNIVAGNDYGINCDYQSTAVITNNTFVGNGTALECAYSSPTVTNNILAFSGVGVRAISALPMLSHNDVYGNVSGYEGVAAGDGDISADPLFASCDLGNLHIQPNSPCRNAGVNGAPSMPETDMDGQPRIIGGTVDIGADESDGQFAASSFRVIYANAYAPPGGDGASWSRAYKTIQAAVDDAAYWGGAEVWVARGTYYECAKLPPFAQLYGGFAGTENSRSQRNWKQNISAIDAEMNGFAVTAPSFSTVDGFTLQNGLEGIRGAAGSA
ncbi:MAG: right-handed parallel beta-helix repeat-containing protein, partial [Armatimonadetes bacterium]|nr:right-handed parallel beta-helix repeat-containing protein [Armatimonadota bacterium]